MLRAALVRLLPRAQYVALESSEYLCRRYGWLPGRIEDYHTSAPFDLVICYDVLQYLSSDAAQRALANFARLCRGVLYFSALTRFDYEHNCDRARTDAQVHLRSARWYRTRKSTSPRGCSRGPHRCCRRISMRGRKAARLRNSGYSGRPSRISTMVAIDSRGVVSSALMTIHTITSTNSSGTSGTPGRR